MAPKSGRAVPLVGAEQFDGFPHAVLMLLDMGLESLTVSCPRCGRTGLAMTKWVKGRKVKPLYVFHRSNGGTIRECRLGGENEDELRGSLALSARDLKRLLRRAKTFVLFSGGTDSLCTLLHLLDTTGTRKQAVRALHVDTTAGFPEVTRYVRQVCNRLAIPLDIVRAERDYFELAKRWGIPGFNARWCCKELKVKPVRDFLATVRGPKIVVDGIRAAESNQRRTYLPVWYHPDFHCLSVSPLLTWSDEQVKARVRRSGLPEGPGKELGCSAECWCGAYKTRGDFEKLLEVHPEIFDKLVEVEEAQKGRFTFIYENGQRVPLKSLTKQKH